MGEQPTIKDLLSKELFIKQLPDVIDSKLKEKLKLQIFTEPKPNKFICYKEELPKFEKDLHKLLFKIPAEYSCLIP